MSKKKPTRNDEPSELQELLEKYKAYLASRSLKFTNQRRVILSEFFRSGGHVSAEELFRSVKKKASGLGLASVYRTINSLVEAGIAVERRFLDRSSLYELDRAGAHHDHLICMRCRKIFEFENDAIEKLQSEVANGLGFTLKDHKLELYGWCQKTNCPNL